MLSLVEQEFGVVCTKVVHSFENTQGTCNTELKNTKSPESRIKRSTDCDDFEGNPLQIEKIVDLSIEPSFVGSRKYSLKPYSRFLDFSKLKPLNKKPDEGYLDNMLYYVQEDEDQFIGFFTKTKTSKRILRISSQFNVDTNRTIKELSQEAMLCFPNFVCTFECIYKLSHGVFDARFETCEDKILSPPPSFASGELTVNIMPYKSNELIPSIFEDIQILKDLYRAYECDSPAWIRDRVIACEQVKAEFPSIFKSVNKVDQVDGKVCGNNFSLLLTRRKLDSTEVIWNLVKGSQNKFTFRTCVEDAFEYLLSNSDLIYLASHNQTQLAWRLRHLHDSTGPFNRRSYGIFSLRIEALIEIGLHKLINDCVYLLESIIPESSSFFEIDKKIGWNLESLWDMLHNLYKSVSFLACLTSMVTKSSLVPELRKILAQKSQENEWKSALYEPDNIPFCITHSFSLLVSELIVPLSQLPPDLWIMRIDAKRPVSTSIRIIYELVTKDGMLLVNLFNKHIVILVLGNMILISFGSIRQIFRFD